MHMKDPWGSDARRTFAADFDFTGHNYSNEPCLFKNTSKKLLIALYVDDLLIFGKDIGEITEIKKSLGNTYKMKDLGIARKFIGINLLIKEDYIKIHMGDYVESLLESYDMQNCVSNWDQPSVDSGRIWPIIGTEDLKHEN